MTLEQFIADTLAVTDYLRNRFGKEKIYLMAHSGGTFIGLQAAARVSSAMSMGPPAESCCHGDGTTWFAS